MSTPPGLPGSSIDRLPVHVAALIGSPVGHSLSPAMHNAAFTAGGLDWVYVAFEVPPGGVERALEAVRSLGIAGLSVTTPHKEAAAAAVDSLAPAAAALRSVNTVVASGDGSLVGHSTDGDGFVASLAEAGVGVDGVCVAVVGAGAAARSVIDALGRGGATEIVVVNRTASHAAEAATLCPVGRVGTGADLAGAAIVVNATSVGLGSNDLPFNPALLRASQVVADLVYHPLRTALLDAATERGCRTVDGLGMLVHQAALQQHLWTGIHPDTSVMREAALSRVRAAG